MSSVRFYGSSPKSSPPAFLLPNQLDKASCLALENHFTAARLVYVMLAEEEPDVSLSAFLERDCVQGLLLSKQDTHLEATIQHLKDVLAEGKFLLFVPGKSLCAKGNLRSIPSATLLFLLSLGLPTLPVSLDNFGAMGLAQDHEPITQLGVHFSPLLPEPTPSHDPLLRLSALLENWMEAREIMFQGQPFLQGSLTATLIRGLKAHPYARLIDGVDDSSLPYSHLLGAAIAFAKHLKTLTHKRRVGIILPPGKGCVLANLACLFAGKVPVNFNFTASHEAIESAITQSEVDKFITADLFMRRCSEFPWPPKRDLILLEQERVKFQSKAKWWMIATRFLPTELLLKLLDAEAFGGDDEAALLFTSGSSGAPKGVPLSHKNILANIAQCYSRIDLHKNSRILGCLPIFHSFGCTITLFFPLILGFDLITYPSPKESKRLGELLEKYSIELFVSTPTFLRPLIKRVPAEQLKTLRYMIVGSEKLSPDLSQSFKDHFGFYPIEGYGLTEASPVCCVNMPNRQESGNTPVLPSAKIGTVGQALPGLALKITDSITEEPASLFQTGMIWLKGSNIFPGYLNEAKLNAQILKNGWFCTGDVGHLDAEGFLHIEGRISRFSKIGGEMVPHEQLEIAILRALKLDPTHSERQVVVLSLPDPQKGEVIVLLSTVFGPNLSQDLMVLHYNLLDQGIPALWCPKRLIPVKEIPMLPSGKIDLTRCQKMLEEALKISPYA